MGSSPTIHIRALLLLAALFVGADGAHLRRHACEGHGVVDLSTLPSNLATVDESVTLLQTSVSQSRLQDDGLSEPKNEQLRGDDKLANKLPEHMQLQLSAGATRHARQLRGAVVLTIIVYALYLLIHFCGLGSRLYDLCFEDGKGLQGGRKQGTSKLLMQFTALTWKNVTMNTRTELPLCLRFCNGCCVQMLCPVLYIFLLTMLPMGIVKATGADKDIVTEHGWDFGRDYHDQDLVLQPGMGDLLFQPPSFLGLGKGNTKALTAFMKDPLVSLWHPMGMLPQGACFCRTLGIVGPRAADFQHFANQSYTSWHSQRVDASRMIEATMAGVHCPSNYTGTLFRVFSSTSEVDNIIGSYDYTVVRPGRSEYSPDRLCGLVVFENDPLTSVVPRFQVRTNITGMDPMGERASKTVKDEQKGQDLDSLSWYLHSGFLSVQDLVQRFVSKSRLGDAVSLPEPSFAPLPTAPYHDDMVKKTISGVIADPGTATSTFTVTVMLVAYFMIRERNSRQKELMRLMGLYDSSLVLSWVSLFALMGTVCSLGCSFMVYAAVVEHSDFFPLFLIFFLTTMATIGFGMVISSLFSSERLGALLAFAAYNILGLIYHVTVPGGETVQDSTASKRLDDANPATLYLVSICPNIAFTICMKTFFELDRSRTGCTWKYIYKTVNKYNVGGGLGMLFFDIFFWGLLHAYLEQVIPHQVGSTRPWYFLFTRSFWRECFGRDTEDTSSGQQLSTAEPVVQEGRLFEPEDSEQLEQLRRRKAVIAVRDLRKTFVNASGAEIRAVNGLNLTMYEGECFCLLGHNGAGKTTAMGVITGMLDPTAGEVNVIGYNMPEEKTQARAHMGFCMQQNVLWDTLTVKEHVILFASLMGLGPSAAEESCNTVLSRVELKYKQNSPESALSGGMKRKLNVALALVGDSRVLLLDEPTAGMDPHTRRRLWGVLKQSRAEKIMCLTTHYMDEADELGDRVAIMVHGKSVCCGTNGFLKQRLGCGYLLNFVKVQEEVENEPIEDLVRKHCGQDACREGSAVGRELRLQVPFESAKHFPALMRELDGRLAALGLESYGVGVSDLEDVFLRVANGDELEALQAGTTPPPRRAPVAGEAAERRPAPRAEPTVGKQFVGLFQRRVRYGFRDSRMFCCQLLVPILIMAVFLGLTRFAGRNRGNVQSLALDTTGWLSGGHGGVDPMLVSVGVIPSNRTAATSVAFGWLGGDMPGVSDIAFNASSSSRRVDENQPTTNSQHWAEETNFAHWAYRLAYGPKSSQYNKSSAEQFGGLLYSGDHVTIYPNTSASYSAPVLFNLHFTAAMRSAKPKGARAAPERLEVLSRPFQPTHSEESFIHSLVSFAMGLVVMSAYSFIATGIAAYITMEREMDVKHQLMVSGSSRTAYWLSNFAFDSIFGLVSFVSTMIILAIFGASTWLAYPTIQATVALLLLFVPAVSAFAYFWSHLFGTSGSTLVGVLLFGLFVGSIGLEISHALMIFSRTRKYGEILLWVTRALLPSACVGDGLLHLAANKEWSKLVGMSPFSGFIFGTEKCLAVRGSMPCLTNAGDSIAMLLIDTLLYVTLTVIADWIHEHPGVAKWFQLAKDPICPWELRRKEDEKVRAERERVAGLDPASQILMVSNVTKVYRQAKGDVHAVRGVSFAVEPGHVFGLLGTNGAGKTTTFKMICGQIVPSSGRIFVKGMDVSEDLHGVRQHIGYCPQFDALLDLMTVQEHLELYARIKGFTGKEMEAEMQNKMETMHLTEYADSRAGQLSGGNKRKLSTAIALIGEPDVIFLDEPSAGMDPLARRRMWDVIQTVALRRRSSAVILTTHSMEEADALCTRIGIQCSGQLRCLGSPQQLKEWYGTGLELNLRMEAPTHKDSEALCSDWDIEPQKTCHVSKAQQLVSDFFAKRRLSERAPPMVGKADTLAIAALAEWCLQEERSEGLAAFLAEACGGEEHLSCVERAAGSLRYKLTGECAGGGPRPYGELFETLEQHRDQYRLADFQLSQGTLEQTFNRLAAEDIALRGEDDSDTEGQDGRQGS